MSSQVEGKEYETCFTVADFQSEAGAGEFAGARATPYGSLDALYDRRSHCPQCGCPTGAADLVETRLISTGKCERCAATIPTTHRIVVVGIGLRSETVLLVKRAVGPRLGRWTLPGGYVEVGELMPEALSREFIEEANVEIDRPHLLALYEMPQLNQLFAVHVADLKSGVVAPGHESIAAQFFAVDDLPIDDLAFPTDACVLRDFAKHGRNADQGVKIGYFYWKRDGRIRMRAHV